MKTLLTFVVGLVAGGAGGAVGGLTVATVNKPDRPVEVQTVVVRVEDSRPPPPEAPKPKDDRAEELVKIIRDIDERASQNKSEYKSLMEKYSELSIVDPCNLAEQKQIELKIQAAMNLGSEIVRFRPQIVKALTARVGPEKVKEMGIRE